MTSREALVVRDDPVHGGVAATLLTDAELIAVALPCFCEYWLGGENFVSFDRKAVALLAAQGQSARLL